jgi:hypothetical protein
VLQSVEVQRQRVSRDTYIVYISYFTTDQLIGIAEAEGRYAMATGGARPHGSALRRPMQCVVIITFCSFLASTLKGVVYDYEGW